MLSMIIGMFVLATIASNYCIIVSSLISIISAVVGNHDFHGILIILLGAVWLFMEKPLTIHLTYHNLFPHFDTISNVIFSVVVFLV